MRFKIFFFTLTVSSLIVGCASTVDNRGYEDEGVDFSQIKPGVHTQAQVLEKLGSPSTTATFKTTTWYYASKVTSSSAFFTPKVMTQRVMAISFTPNGLVEKVEEVKSTDFKDIVPSKNKTETIGHESGVLKEVFSNFGRMSTKKPKKS